MKILSLGLDRLVLDQNSKTAKRVAEYRNLVEKYIILVPERRFKPLALFDLYKRSKDIIEKENIDLITVQDQYFIGLLGYLLAQKYKIGLNIQIHGFEKFFGIRKWIAKFVIPRANSIRVVSRRLKSLLIKEFSVDEEKITIVPIYVEMLNVKRQMLNVKKNNKFIFLTVGRLVSIKNISLQIEAMAELIRELNAKRQMSQPMTGASNVKGQMLGIELWIVGDGPELNNLKSLCQKLNVESNVLFLGWQDNVDDYYARADAFLLTSDNEGWGMAVIEAASFGLPIIMTNVGLAEEIIIDNESGLVIPAGDKQGLVQAMFKLIEDVELRAKLASGAMEAIKKIPTKEEILRLYKESWQKALK